MRESYGDVKLTGNQIESETIGLIDCGWDGSKFVKHLDAKENGEANAMLHEWLKDKISEEVANNWRRYSDWERFDILKNWVKKNQNAGWNPAEPKNPKFAGSLLAGVGMEFDLSDEDLGSLLLYSSAQTPLDTLFGTDGFFEFKGSIFKFDVTGNEEKDPAKVKADYIMLVRDVEDKESLTKHAELIAKNWKLQMKIEKQRIEAA